MYVYSMDVYLTTVLLSCVHIIICEHVYVCVEYGCVSHNSTVDLQVSIGLSCGCLYVMCAYMRACDHLCVHKAMKVCYGMHQVLVFVAYSFYPPLC